MSNSYRTIAAFTAQSDAESFRELLQTAGFQAKVIDGRVAAEGAPDMHVYEVQVPRDDLGDAGGAIAAARAPSPGWRKQFRLRSLFVKITVACLVLAVVRQFGIGQWGQVFLGISFIFVGVEVIVMELVIAGVAHASWHWHRAPGRITQSYIQETGNGDYQTRISYRYQAEGLDYEAGTISYVAKTTSGMYDAYEAYRADILRFPAGLAVDVFYDPDQPMVAVLQRGAKVADVAVCCVLGVALIAVGIAAFLWF